MRDTPFHIRAEDHVKGGWTASPWKTGAGLLSTRCTQMTGMSRRWNSNWMRRRSSRATSSWRDGAVRTWSRTVEEFWSKFCKPRMRGPSTIACDQDASPRSSAAAASSACKAFSWESWGERATSTKACDQSRLRFARSEEHTSELQSRQYLVCRLLLENK